MPEDYYGDGGGTAESSSASRGNEEPNDTGVTAVVPSEMCPGMKVGDEMVVKIVGVDDDSYEIGYKPKEGKGEQEEAPAPAPAPEGSMASMME